MKIKIVKCENNSFWYKEYIGHIFDVMKDDGCVYTVKGKNDSNCWLVDKLDAEIVAEYDNINPEHYRNYSVECIDMMIAIYGKEKVATYCELAAFKYRMRMGTKPNNPIDQDLDKEKWYLNKAKELKSE